MQTRVRSETFYVTQRRFDADVIDVFVIRYTFDGPAVVKAEHLRGPDLDPLSGALWPASTRWVQHSEGTVLQPCLSIPGVLAHLLLRTEAYDAQAAEAAVEALFAKVLGR